MRVVSGRTFHSSSPTPPTSSNNRGRLWHHPGRKTIRESSLARPSPPPSDDLDLHGSTAARTDAPSAPPSAPISPPSARTIPSATGRGGTTSKQHPGRMSRSSFVVKEPPAISAAPSPFADPPLTKVMTTARDFEFSSTPTSRNAISGPVHRCSLLPPPCFVPARSVPPLDGAQEGRKRRCFPNASATAHRASSTTRDALDE
mmetsp:Transcript_37458/g.112346  ORF Transcript_37458/g.112346 Transcript_37458/m.112346 type:complete len:202 (+) Transcript_37458:2552-3157(+)